MHRYQAIMFSYALEVRHFKSWLFDTYLADTVAKTMRFHAFLKLVSWGLRGWGAGEPGAGGAGS